MKDEKNGVKQKRQQVWISTVKKEVFLTEVKEYERIEFKKYEELLDYIRACAECGYKVG